MYLLQLIFLVGAAATLNMADVTGIFKSVIKMLKVRNKELSTITSGPGDDRAMANGGLGPSSSEAMKANGKFSERTRSIVSIYIQTKTLHSVLCKIHPGLAIGIEFVGRHEGSQCC